ncbi:Cold-inducible RNA-binding protein B [Liparis tanakae]|uniref:Cold-inducible RNA-binding protein B n=1 Tax=Liparis tanakae TaxID=230148 RepID=A0A4Z2FN57_9TELE|nr:Cold-inducible RNA-binding protein B [Liparis tanakae]
MSDEGKLAVERLNYDTTTDSLTEAFSKYGAVKDCQVIMDRESNISRGFGYVTYENPDDAQKAIDGMNGKELEGRQISVRMMGELREDRFDRMQERGRGRGRGDGRGRGGYYRQPYQTNE